jgi:hypothetical protein
MNDEKGELEGHVNLRCSNDAANVTVVLICLRKIYEFSLDRCIVVNPSFSRYPNLED